MLLDNPFATLSPTGVDSAVLSVLTKASTVFTPAQVQSLAPGAASLSAVRRSLARLSEMGIVCELSIGRSLGYTINEDHILAPAVHAVAQARSDLFARITKAIAAWNTEVTCILFGSAARGGMRPESDIDLFFVHPVVDDALEDNISQLCADIHSWCGNTANPLVLSYESVADTPLVREIWRDGIALFGEKNVLNELSGGQLDESTGRKESHG